MNMCNMEQGTKTSPAVEVWRSVVGYMDLYEVSNLGRVRSLERYYTQRNGYSYHMNGCIMSPFDTKDGYKAVRFRANGTRKTFRVHRLVAEAFVPNPDNLPVVNHKDENKTNNCADNLEWCSVDYNLHYGTSSERLSRSHKNHPRLSKPIEQYTMDGQLIQTFPSSAEAARQLGLHAVNISCCCRGIYKQCGGYLWKYQK